MNHCRGLRLLLAGLLGWAAAGPVSAAQPPPGDAPAGRPSHRLLDDGAAGTAGLEELLKQKFDLAQEQDQLLKAVQGFLNDPKQREKLKGLAPQFEQLGNQPERLQAL